MESKKSVLGLNEQFATEQAQVLGDLANEGKWTSIKTGMFPLIPRVSVELALEAAFDNRLAIIAGQMEQLKGMADLVGDDTKSQDKIRGRAIELQKEVVEIISVRFTETSPVSASKEERIAVLEQKIDKLSKSLSVYEEWKALDLDCEMFGYTAFNETNQKSYLDKLADNLIKKTVGEIERLSLERLDIK